MDKRVVFAVAGSGKTTTIINSLSPDKRSLIVTYTNGNYNNILRRISEKFNGRWPESIHVMKYFTFLYKFCYKPFLSDEIKAKGICFEKNRRFDKKSNIAYYISEERYIYSNRLALLIEEKGYIKDVLQRLEEYFDEFIIDEIQDIAGRDFSFLEKLMEANINMLFVGDYYQHTYDTSNDGNKNKKLFDSFDHYESRFTRKGFISDKTSLARSWRCSHGVCEFITDKLGIKISSNKKPTEEGSDMVFVNDKNQIEEIMSDKNITKLHYNGSKECGMEHKNWGGSKRRGSLQRHLCNTQ